MPTNQETTPGTSEPNEGEGNKTAARRYNKATEEYVKSGRADEAAREAEEALEGDEGEELRRAEEIGKSQASDVELDKEIPEKDIDIDEGDTAADEA